MTENEYHREVSTISHARKS